MRKKRKSRSFWEDRVKACDQAGISKTAYCKQNNLTYSQFLYWDKRTQKARPNFIPIKAASHQNRAGICTLEFPTGHRLILNTAEALTMLPKLLEALC